MCVIGMKQPVMIPLITFDAFVNVYLTLLFLIPLLSEFGLNKVPPYLGSQVWVLTASLLQ